VALQIRVSEDDDGFLVMVEVMVEVMEESSLGTLCFAEGILDCGGVFEVNLERLDEMVFSGL
jgi:hypothetical protein